MHAFIAAESQAESSLDEWSSVASGLQATADFTVRIR
jgi:hypothetical protein